MNEISSHRKLAEDLPKQDSDISETQMQEQRARLVVALERAEQKERMVRRATIISGALLALMVLVMSAYLVAFPIGRVVGGSITFILLILTEPSSVFTTTNTDLPYQPGAGISRLQ